MQNEQQIRTGRGLARAVESETPGLYHRHVLNYLIRLRPDWSPPFQALVWAGLDVTIASALQAAWYYKWLAEDPPLAYQNGATLPVARPNTSFRPRPIEYACANGDTSLTVLFDNPDELNPTRIECPPSGPVSCPPTNPAQVLSVGTPRHPSYPSGHSTYSAAASEYLTFFFGNLATPPSILATQPAAGSPPVTTLQQEFRFFADNIGLGRLWAGVHWLSDHTAGAILGRVVARLVIKQLTDMLGRGKVCMQPQPCSTAAPPAQSDVKADAIAFRDQCQPADRPTDLPQPASSCPPPNSCEAPLLLLPPLTEDAIATFGNEVDLRQLSRSAQQGGGLPSRVIVPSAQRPPQKE
jgi:membrane-associated phospholipid phosphatase